VRVFHTERELDIDVRSLNDRVRYVLLARVGAAREAAPTAELRARLTLPRLAAAIGRTPGQLRRAIDELDVEEDDSSSGQLISQICAVIGDSVTAQFVLRASRLDPTSSWDLDAVPSWWPEVKDLRFDTPLIALIGAHVLEAKLQPMSGARPSNTSTFASPTPTDGPTVGDQSMTSAEWFSRRRLARALLSAATSRSGHAFESQVMLERLCPVMLADIMEFAEHSPRWLPVVHILDRSLRTHYGDDTAHREILSKAHAFVLSDRFLVKLRERPPRSAAAVRPVRRVALGRNEGEALDVAKRISDIAADGEIAPRARRYSLWTLAELHAQHPTSADLGELTEAALTQAEAVDELGDVVQVLREHAGGYLCWQDTFFPQRGRPPWTDSFDVDLRSGAGHIAWPLAPEALSAVRRHVGADTEAGLYAKPWERVPRRLVAGGRRMTIEMLVHPGLVRTKAAADTIIQAGPIVTTAVTRSLCSLLRHHLTRPVLPTHLVEGALANLGYFRNEAALETLVDVATTPVAGADVRAAALTSLGDVMAHSNRGDQPRRPKHWYRGLAAIGEGLDPDRPLVAHAAVRAAAAVRATAFADKIRELRTRSPDGSTLERLAEWCLDSWDPVARHEL
jgi:hypothetical protein